MQLVATTDAVIEGVHFDLRRFSPEDVGWKALAVNLSDLAAAGARPRWFLCALGIPASSRVVQIAQRISRGMSSLARKSRCALIGGNVTSAGARPGDALVVIGSLGDAAAGLRSYPSPVAARAQRRPVPRVREGLLVAPFASAAIDVSDGFLQDLGHICAESSVGAVVECSSLPLGKAARRLPDGMELALGGGEDYALLLTVPKRKLPALRKKLRLVEVGRIVRGRGIQLTELGSPRPLPRRSGFDHLRK